MWYPLLPATSVLKSKQYMRHYRQLCRRKTCYIWERGFFRVYTELSRGNTAIIWVVKQRSKQKTVYSYEKTTTTKTKTTSLLVSDCSGVSYYSTTLQKVSINHPRLDADHWSSVVKHFFVHLHLETFKRSSRDATEVYYTKLDDRQNLTDLNNSQNLRKKRKLKVVRCVVSAYTCCSRPVSNVSR